MELTGALLALAVVVLAVVAWQAYWPLRKAKGKPLRRAADVRADPPVLTERAEPPFAPTEAGEEAPAPAALRAAMPRGQPRLDALIDALVPMQLEQPVTGDLLLSHMPASRRAGSKPFYIEGLHVDTADWEPPRPGQRYGELQAGVQLANRSGALNEIEFSEFVQKLQVFADAVGATLEVPDMLDVVARARELDAFANPRDAKLTVTLRSDVVAWSVGYVLQCAQRQGFVASNVPGRLVRLSNEEGAPPVLTLSFDAQAAMAEDPQKAVVRECQLNLDVPQTPASDEPFPAWHDAARQPSDEMAATVVDDFGEPITLHAFAVIGQELQQLYAQLESHDLAAGSAAARRLFSG